MMGCTVPPSTPTQTPLPTSIPPTLLPTAVPPESFPGTWAVSFEYAFPLNYWRAGYHRYAYLIQCPTLAQETVRGEWQWFQVSEDAILQPAPIYLRLGGLSTGPLAPFNIERIHPDQATLAVVTFLGVKLEDIEAVQSTPGASACEVVIRWDDKGSRNLEPGEYFQP
jgi:hypothetical protein